MIQNKPKTAIALGSFDGLHKGHKEVITCALSCKECGLIPVILLFDSHPLLSLTGKAPDEILQNQIREEILYKMGIKSEYISFNDIKNYTPEEFFYKILIDKLNAGAICCGHNYKFGKNGSGTAKVIHSLCEKVGIECKICPDVELYGDLISSTRIREAIKDGNIPLANEMLGYEFTYRAVVSHGNERGRLMGFPTINQYFNDGFIVPKYGVYASVAVVNGKEYPSITNIGFRPSFEDDDIRSETHIVGLDNDLYGTIVDIKLLYHIRGEQKFDSLDTLGAQIKKDKQISMEIFEKRGLKNV